jgi:heptosyltransferase-2
VSGPVATPLRLLVIMPSWVGDAVMATPALRLLRDSLPGAFIGGLVRPGIDELMAGSSFFDEVHVERARGVMGPKIVASRLRGRRYDTALLLTNSFSTALIARLAFIPRRIGYDRDGRGMLLTDRLDPPRRARPQRGWAPVSAVEYYLRAAGVALGSGVETMAARLELGVTEEQEAAGGDLLQRAGLEPGRAFMVLNPGGNNVAKRWGSERFAEVGRRLSESQGMAVVINGSPEEAALAEEVGAGIAGADGSSRVPVVLLPRMGVTIGSLKAVVRRASLMVTNDTGPRHIAAAFGVPTVALFGPTDARWTALPAGTPEVVVVADPTLPAEMVADDYPERCRIDRIGVEEVVRAAETVMGVGRRG